MTSIYGRKIIRSTVELFCSKVVNCTITKIARFWPQIIFLQNLINLLQNSTTIVMFLKMMFLRPEIGVHQKNLIFLQIGNDDNFAVKCLLKSISPLKVFFKEKRGIFFWKKLSFQLEY